MAWVIRVSDPSVETTGEFLCWASGCLGFRTTAAPEFALTFGSRSAAYRFRKLHAPMILPVGTKVARLEAGR